MKGRRRFSAEEEKKIRRFISDKVNSDIIAQKRSRVQLRMLGFYISDFTNSKKGFALQDFEILKRTGQIIIDAK